MSICTVALGANLGDPSRSVQMAAKALAEHPSITRFQLSSLYRTPPFSPIPQPDFTNAVCQFSTTLAPFELLTFCQYVEKILGKTPKGRDEPRSIDLDILLYGRIRIDHPLLEVPHPRFLQRPFVLYPLRDLSPSIELPDGQIIDLNSRLIELGSTPPLALLCH